MYIFYFPAAHVNRDSGIGGRELQRGPALGLGAAKGPSPRPGGLHRGRMPLLASPKLPASVACFLCALPSQRGRALWSPPKVTG